METVNSMNTIFPTTAATDVMEGFFGVVASNIGPVLALMGITLGIGWVVRRFGSAKKGKI